MSCLDRPEKWAVPTGYVVCLKAPREVADADRGGVRRRHRAHRDHDVTRSVRRSRRRRRLLDGVGVHRRSRWFVRDAAGEVRQRGGRGDDAGREAEVTERRWTWVLALAAALSVLPLFTA